MKKIYLSIISIFAAASVFAQAPACVATYSAAGKAGVFPDSTTNLLSGTVGVPYVQNLTAIVPDDTVSGIRVCFTRFELSNPSGSTNFDLPAGLAISGPTINTTTANVYQFKAGQTSCAVIYGTPTTAGTYHLKLLVTAYGNVQPFGSCPSTPNYTGGSSLSTQNINYYIIVVSPPVGVKEYGKDKFGLLQNTPNPFSDKTTIKYYVESEDNVTLTVYNALGAIVYQATDKSKMGENSFELNAEGLSSGMYMYSVKYKNIVDTKRLMISNNH